MAPRSPIIIDPDPERSAYRDQARSCGADFINALFAFDRHLSTNPQVFNVWANWHDDGQLAELDLHELVLDFNVHTFRLSNEAWQHGDVRLELYWGPVKEPYKTDLVFTLNLSVRVWLSPEVQALMPRHRPLLNWLTGQEHYGVQESVLRNLGVTIDDWRLQQRMKEAELRAQTEVDTPLGDEHGG